MSETKPFVWVEPCPTYERGYTIKGFDPIEGVIWFDSERAQRSCDQLNAAVEAERRKAAADALRKVADGANPIITLDDDEVMAVTQAELLELADSIEKGEA